MRKATIFWLGMAALCGTVLFHTSQEATDGRQALRRMERDMLREEESLRVLRAEWSYLNQPERLEKLARQYLELTPLQGRQFARLSDLNERVDEEMLREAAAQEMHDAFEPAAGDPAPEAPKPPAAVAKAPAKTAPPAPKAVSAAPAPRPAAAPPVQAKREAPIAQPVVQMAPRPTNARAFTDVMKSLGVDKP
jgi:hypothetical protein